MNADRSKEKSKPRTAKAGEVSAFQELEASHLFCPKCRCAMPVRKQMQANRAGGVTYEYRCVHCAACLGKKSGGPCKPFSTVA